MGYKLQKSDMQKVFDKLKEKYIIYAPKLFEGTGTFSDTNIVRYDNISNVEEIEFEKKSELLPFFPFLHLSACDILYASTKNRAKHQGGFSYEKAPDPCPGRADVRFRHFRYGRHCFH